MTIMVIGLVIRRMPYTVRSTAAILQQIPMNMEEAALSLGSSKIKTFYKITMPMMAAGIISGAILSWITMISELSTAILLYTARTKTLTSKSTHRSFAWQLWHCRCALHHVAVLTIISLMIFNRVLKDGDLSM